MAVVPLRIDSSVRCEPTARNPIVAKCLDPAQTAPLFIEHRIGTINPVCDLPDERVKKNTNACSRAAWC
jgi:hypothetical protein